MIIRRLATAVPLALALTAPFAMTATADSTATPPSSDSLLLGVSDVISGTVAGTPGNRHQFYLIDGVGGPDGYLRSWSCPPGATVTTRWVSSSCDHRLTQDLRKRWGTNPSARISSTGRSGSHVASLTGVNRDSGYKRNLSSDLVAFAEKDAVAGASEGSWTWSQARVSGYLGGGRVWVRGEGAFFGWLV